MGNRGRADEAEFDIKVIRKAFPYLAEVTYLNTAAAGLSWAGQGAAAARFYDQPKSRGYAGRVEWCGEMDRTRNLLAQLLRVPAEDISFASSTTEALNAIAHGVQLGPADQVILCDDEFPSVSQAWSPAALGGADLVRVAVPEERLRTEALLGAITGSTKVVAVSHVHWSTGTRVDLGRISAACRQVGARLVVDGAHAVGATDVDASVADFYTGSVFKWLLSGFGIAYAVTRRSLASELEPVFRGYINEPPSRSLQYSHTNYPALYPLSATLEFLGTIGWARIFGRVRRLSALLCGELRGEGWDVVTPEGEHAGIISFAHPNAGEAVARLLALGVNVAERTGCVRVSPHFYNTETDIVRFLEALGRNAD
jgi:cysteine desulfurase / selenocysteine lyase